MRTLIESGNKVNVMNLAYATKLGLCTRKINVGVQKINRSYLDIFRIVIADCSVKDKLGRVRFFQETFLLANIGLEVVLGMLFLTLSKEDIRYVERELVQRTYTADEALLITRRVEIIDKKKFAAAALNEDNETFVVHLALLAEPTTMLIYSSRQAKVAVLMSEKTRIFVEYSDFSNVFLQTTRRSYQSIPELMITLLICQRISNRLTV